MEFPKYNFNRLNETDIREEIIAPLLRYLGYRSGTDNNVIREQPLSYPKSYLGRKKSNDPILRGRADYICEVHAQFRWVIEAKSPDATLDQDAEEQSWSYANHPEIRAVYFCLSNGREFKIFQTNKGPEAEAIFKCKYDELESSLDAIKNILSPDSILRDWREYVIDKGVPIGPGLRSIVRITNGLIIFKNNTLNLQPFIGLSMSITEGSVERNDFGKLEAYIETEVPFQSLQNLNEKLGLHFMRLFSDSSSVSVDIGKPTVFSSTTNHILPKGEKVLNLATWKEVPLPMNIHVQTQTTASGHLEGNIFQGEFNAIFTYHEYNLQVGLNGGFRIHLA